MALLRIGMSGPAVEHLQIQLASLDFDIRVDGSFGPRTESTVRAYQVGAGISATGQAALLTRAALIADCAARREPELRDFRGSLGLTLSWEGFQGVAYKPHGDASGVTLDPGVDLGRQPLERVRDLYGGIFSSEQLRLLGTAIGLRGAQAKAWADAHGREFEITREKAAGILPRIAPDYWRPLVRWMPEIPFSTTPAPVHTALFSFQYNDWFEPDERVKLRGPLIRRDWKRLADVVETLGAGTVHERRRAAEAALIRSAAK